MLLILLFSCPALRSQSPDAKPIEINFRGKGPVPGAELATDLKTCLGKGWQSFNDKDLTFLTRKCARESMHARGFWRAAVTDINMTIVSGTLSVEIVVDEGPRYRLGKALIEGNRVVSRSEILGLWNQRPGEIADGSKLQDLVFRKLKDRYDELGYVQYSAEFDPDFLEAQGRENDGVVNVMIVIDEGRQYKVGKVGFRGVGDKEREAITRQFALSPGEILTMKGLRAAIERFNEASGFEPVDVDRDVEMDTDEVAGTIALEIRVKRFDPLDRPDNNPPSR